jgi:hypothetical protein
VHRKNVLCFTCNNFGKKQLICSYQKQRNNYVRPVCFSCIVATVLKLCVGVFRAKVSEGDFPLCQTRATFQIRGPNVNRFSRTLIFGYSLKIFRDNSSSINKNLRVKTNTLHKDQYTFLVITRLILLRSFRQTL